MTELLLAHGADISIEDNGGRNALHHLLGPVTIAIPAFADEDFEATATLLLAAGAVPDRVSYRFLGCNWVDPGFLRNDPVHLEIGSTTRPMNKIIPVVRCFTRKRNG